MADLINQGGVNPTRKLSAAVIAAAVVSLSRAISSHFWPEFSDQTLWDALLPIAVYIAGFVVKDEANVVVVQPVVEHEFELGEPNA